MILIDYSGIAVSSLFAQEVPEEEMTEGLLRHTILNVIRSFVVEHGKNYCQEESNIILAADSGSWRKGVFPNYKANRKKSRDKSKVDWDWAYSIFSDVWNELSESSPYRCIKVDSAEADDIIGVIAERYSQIWPILIISSDKDFVQLQRFGNIKQYSPSQRAFIDGTLDRDLGAHDTGRPHRFLFEHILKGDSGDGIPNILSDDDVLITEGVRQRPMTKKKIDQWWEERDNLMMSMTTDEYKNYQRNQKLVTLSTEFIPHEIVKAIESKFNSNKKESFHSREFLKYLVTKKCYDLIESYNDFYINAPEPQTITIDEIT
jgi:5'-3' exonuclease